MASMAGMAQALLPGDELHQLVGALDVDGAVLQRAGGGGRAHQALRGGGVFLERHQIVGLGAELDAQVEHEIVDRARGLDVAVHRLLGGAHAVLGDAAIVAGEQHRPFGERHEDRVVDLELDRQLDLALGRVVADRLDLVLQLPQDGGGLLVGEARHLEVGRQRDQEHVDLLVGRADRLRVRAVERDGGGIERVPHARIRIGRLERLVVEARDALHVGQAAACS